MNGDELEAAQRLAAIAMAYPELNCSEAGMVTRLARDPLPRLDLVNGDFGSGRTLLDVVDRVATATLGVGRHNAYVVTCYFDLPAVIAFARTSRKRVEGAGGKLAGLLVAIDAGEWIRCRMPIDDLRREIERASRVSNVSVVPVRAQGQLLHAKAYAVISEAKTREGFLVVTSGNATQRGFGLASNANIELATVATDGGALLAFEQLVKTLLEHRLSEADALRQDEFLRALALFSAGAFYHRWQGSLASEVRFKLTLTDEGKRVRKRDATVFRGYEPDSDTISRDPLEIEKAFERIPKPFPASFWRTYAVDTLLGYWIPAPIAEVVDRKLGGDVEAYLNAIRDRTRPARVDKTARKLLAQVRDYSNKGLVAESLDVVEKWQDRVERFRENEDILRLRILPYERVPDLLDGASRDAILKMRAALSTRLDSKTKLRGTKAIVAAFLNGELDRGELEQELESLAQDAERMLRKHDGSDGS